MKTNSRGFTLIELLVVIAIIGLLSAVVLASLNVARAKARDARRMTDLAQLQTALELYYSTTGHYPITNGWVADCWLPTSNWIPDNGNYNWSASDISAQPHDPVDTCTWPFNGPGPSATYAYYGPDGKSYALITLLEECGPYDVQNANSTWSDGHLLYSYYNWFPCSYIVDTW